MGGLGLVHLTVHKNFRSEVHSVAAMKRVPSFSARPSFPAGLQVG